MQTAIFAVAVRCQMRLNRSRGRRDRCSMSIPGNQEVDDQDWIVSSLALVRNICYALDWSFPIIGGTAHEATLRVGLLRRSVR
jgi:hypothetical protein